ncbi:MAG: MerR family transcriptional regulator [Firmicutes bacterium]|nr:MerR family transcriptional regulator [Bacillota bacterium]MBR3184338.1 MerR family transcriptional regulator [Bacillota bacterium]
MTIKEFAKLVNCNPQTLRYYDSVDLLKPAGVDKFSGYRHYDEEQALDFVKIRNLQTAGFTIVEIKELLGKDNDEIFEAFEQKIRLQEELLTKIREIQKSYQSEYDEMKEKIREIKEKVAASMAEYDPREEFGIDNEKYQEIVDKVNDYFEEIAARDGGDIDYEVFENGEGAEEEEKYLAVLDDPDYEVIYENHGWENVKDFIDEFETPAEGREFVFCFQLAKDKADNTAFANTLLGIMIGKNKWKKKENDQTLNCNVTDSKDGQNHFWLLKKKQ